MLNGLWMEETLRTQRFCLMQLLNKYNHTPKLVQDCTTFLSFNFLSNILSFPKFNQCIHILHAFYLFFIPSDSQSLTNRTVKGDEEEEAQWRAAGARCSEWQLNQESLKHLYFDMQDSENDFTPEERCRRDNWTLMFTWEKDKNWFKAFHLQTVLLVYWICSCRQWNELFSKIILEIISVLKQLQILKESRETSGTLQVHFSLNWSLVWQEVKLVLVTKIKACCSHKI